MGKAPAFQLYSNDFLVDTMDWSIEEVGIYTRLLFYQWTNGSIPSDPKRLSRIAGCDLKKFQKYFQKVVCKFESTDSDSMQNLRLEEVRQKQQKYAESRKENVKKRWDNKDTYVSDVKYTDDTLLLQSSTSIHKNKKPVSKKLTDDEYFEILKSNPAYKGIDIERERAKCEAWCLTNNKLFSRRRLVNWLNRIERPMTIDRPIGYSGRPTQQSELERMKREDATRGEPTEEDIRAAKELVAQLAGAL